MKGMRELRWYLESKTGPREVFSVLTGEHKHDSMRCDERKEPGRRERLKLQGQSEIEWNS